MTADVVAAKLDVELAEGEETRVVSVVGTLDIMVAVALLYAEVEIIWLDVKPAALAPVPVGEKA